MIGALVSLFVFGLKFGIEFTGGSLLEVEFKNERPSADVIQKKLADLNLGEIIIQPLAQKEVLLRFKEVDEATHQQIISKLKEISDFEEKQFQLIGPQIGKELKQKQSYPLY